MKQERKDDIELDIDQQILNFKKQRDENNAKLESNFNIKSQGTDAPKNPSKISSLKNEIFNTKNQGIKSISTNKRPLGSNMDQGKNKDFVSDNTKMKLNDLKNMLYSGGKPMEQTKGGMVYQKNRSGFKSSYKK